MSLWNIAGALAGLIETFSGGCKVGSVRWMDVGNQLRLVESPLDIAETVKTRLLGSSDEAGSNRSWIFTSATLGDDPSLRWFTEPCGLESAEILKVGSPFDYAAQAAVYVPRQLPKPNDPAHTTQVAQFVASHAPLIQGRTLVLTTTLRALRDGVVYYLVPALSPEITPLGSVAEWLAVAESNGY